MKASTALRQARRRAGLSQRELARKAGVPQSTIGRIEAGLADPRVSTLDRLLRLCGDELDAVPRRGEGIDLGLIRATLATAAPARLDEASEQAAGVALLRAAKPIKTA